LRSTTLFRLFHGSNYSMTIHEMGVIL
jgi:hypothetical protein